MSRYLPRKPASPNQLQRWVTFLRNHRDAIAAMDFFIVPTITLRVLYGLFVIEHGRRRVVHFNATFNPTAAWVIQQLREAFPHDTTPKYLIFDRDSIFSAAVVAFLETLGTKPCRTSFRSPWQNPVAERWVGNCRRVVSQCRVPSRHPHHDGIRLDPVAPLDSYRDGVSGGARRRRWRSGPRKRRR